jgi:hypothetical protein
MATGPVVEFLKHVLGEDGYKAFERANTRMPTLGPALAPRTIVSWLATAIRAQYEGEIPGLANSYISLQKHEEGLTGAVTIGDEVHSFEDADILHVAAAVAVALGVEDAGIDPIMKSTDISKLGKSIDLLVKARVITAAQLQKLLDEESTEQSDCEESEIEKDEMPGKAAGPHEPKAPQAPQGPQAVAPSTNVKSKPPVMKKELVVKKSSAHNECPECGLPQFKGDTFVGCMCFRALAKSISSTSRGDNYVLSLSRSQWDDETIEALLQTFRG